MGQVPLILGPSSWGADLPWARPLPPPPMPEIPPYYGQWGVLQKGTAVMADGGRVGPFDTADEAFSAAAQAAHDHGAELLPTDGFAQVVDSAGRPAGPVT